MPTLDRSLLLAREGVNLDDSLVTHGNLLASLLRAPAALAVLHAGGDRTLDEALSPDGRMLAVRGDDGRVVFFDTTTLRRIGTPFPGSNLIGLTGGLARPIQALAFSPDGRTLAVGSNGFNGAHVAVVDARTHKARAEAGYKTFVAADVAYSPDGHALASGRRGDRPA